MKHNRSTNMPFIHRNLTITLLITAAICVQITGQTGQSNEKNPGQPKPIEKETPVEWVDPATGHRVVRLSRDPGSASLYFHQNPYTAEGDKLVFTTPGGISTINLKTRKIELLVDGRASHMVVGRKTRQVFYLKDGTAFATHIDTRVTRTIVTRPELRSGSGFTVNADETLLGGSFIEGQVESTVLPPASATPGARADSYP